MLYAADRYEHLYGSGPSITASLEQSIVVCDRYVFSSLAYQTVQCDYSLVYELNRRYPLPRHLIYLDVPPEMTETRRRGRSQAEIFENLDFQRAVYERYESALADYADAGIIIHRVDGSVSPQDISDDIWKRLSIPPIN